MLIIPSLAFGTLRHKFSRIKYIALCTFYTTANCGYVCYVHNIIVCYQTVAPPPQLDENTPVDRTLGQGSVTHYQAKIPDEGLTFMFDLEEGKVLICGSRSNRRPDCRDSSTYEWVCETNGYCDIHVKPSSSRRRRQANPDIMFISIEGVEEKNEVKVQITMGDETISNGNE